MEAALGTLAAGFTLILLVVIAWYRRNDSELADKVVYVLLGGMVGGVTGLVIPQVIGAVVGIAKIAAGVTG